nr:4'-phosphopantetheinyl transferase superfamily protein [uncultured Pseudodesulfovibrio sp.]
MILFCDGIEIAVRRAPVGDNRRTLAEIACTDLSFDMHGFSLEKVGLGVPKLVGENQAPAISFTSSREIRWCAVAWCKGLGIDVACPEEFEPPYPVSRVFDAAEIKLTEAHIDDQLSQLALLWSFKEAAAKAMGTGFNAVEPGELTAAALHEKDDKLNGIVTTPGGKLPVVAIRVSDCWLAIARR